MPGFDKTDSVGYRNNALRAGGSVSYNGFIFPPALNSRVTVVPEYDKGGRVCKYLTVALNIEFILTEPTLEPYQVGVSESTNKIKTTTMHGLMSRLGQPGQPLSFTAQGFGTFQVNYPGSQIKDLDNGPKPQVIEFEPLGGGNAFRVQWLCVTRISPLVDNYRGEFVEFNYSTQWGLDPSGYMIRSVEGNFEFLSQQKYSAASEQAERYNITMPTLEVAKAKAFLHTIFPLLPGFRRQYFYRVKEDKKTLEFKLEDTEIRSPSPFPPGVSDFELNKTVTSDLKAGFLSWKVTFTGRIESVNPKGTSNTSSESESKKLAWFWLNRILLQERINFEEGIKLATSLDNQKLGPGVTSVYTHSEEDAKKNDTYTPEKITKANKSFMMYPVFISFTDSIYSNSITFTVGYIAIVTASLLGRALNLFEPIKVEGLDSNTHVRYLNLSNVYSDSTTPFPSTDVLVDICNPLTPPAAGASNADGSPKSEPTTLTSVTKSDPGKDWTKHENKVTYVEKASTVKGKTLKPKLNPNTGANSVKMTDAEKFPNTVSGDPGKRKINPEPQPNELLHTPLEPASLSQASPINAENALKDVTFYAPTQSTKYIVMEGVAERFGGPISPPKLISVGGAEAYATSDLGMDIVEVNTKKTGLIDPDSVACDIYQVRWKKHYVLDGIPSSGKILTTGNPRRFS